MLEDVGEINDILGRSYGVTDDIEEEDLDAELACLEDEWASEELEMDEGVQQSAGAAADSQLSMPTEPSEAPTIFTRTEATAQPASATANKEDDMASRINALV